MARSRIILIILVAGLILAGAGAWLLNREATLLWVGDSVQASGKVQLEHLSGSLLGGIHVDHLHWQGTKVGVVADNVTLKWAPWWILTGKIAFRQGHADTLEIARSADANTPPAPPHKLQVPWRLGFDNATATTLRYVAVDGSQQTWGDVGFGLDFGVRAWTLAVQQLPTQWGRIKGSGSIGTSPPHDARADFILVPEQGATLPIDVRATAEGTIESLAVHIVANARDGVAEAMLQVAPAATQKVRSIDASLKGFDPHALRAAIPAALLDGQLKAATDADDVLRGHLALANRAAGRLNEGRLPIVSIAADLVAPPGRWGLEGVELDLGAAGELSGSTTFDSAQSTGHFETKALDLNGLHAALHTTHLAGTFDTQGPLDAQHFRLALRDGKTAFALDATAGRERIAINRAQASANGGTATTSGTLTLDATHAFSGNVGLSKFNPAAFGKYPQASLDATFTADGALAPVLQLRGDGKLAPSTLFGLPASGHGRWASRGQSDPAIAIDIAGQIGNTSVAVRGTMRDPRNLQALELDLDLAGKNMAELYTVTGLPFPGTSEYHLSGRLGFGGRIWTWKNFKGQVGHSDLAGEFSIDLSKDRPFMRANLTSERLDLRDLGGFIGATNADGTGPPGRVLAQGEYQLDKLNAADADIQFTGRSIRNEKLPLHRMNAHLTLDHGQVTLHPLDFRAAGGEIDGRITMDARRAPIRTVADIQARGLKLGELAPGVKAATESAGTIDARTYLTMRGNSVGALLGSADGSLVLAMNGGSVSDVMLRLANLDLANALIAKARGDRAIPIRCLVADFAAQDGVLKPRTFVLDTEHTVIRGEGQVNLRSETVAVRLLAEPKDNSVLSLRGPIRIDGPLAKPAVHPEFQGLAARAGAAIALGIVATPFAAIIPFLEKGAVQNVDCDPLILDASRFINTSQPARSSVASAATSSPAPIPQSARPASAQKP